MHGNQFLWAWPLQYRSYGSFLFAFKNGQNFLGQKIESAQKIHASRS